MNNISLEECYSKRLLVIEKYTSQLIDDFKCVRNTDFKMTSLQKHTVALGLDKFNNYINENFVGVYSTYPLSDDLIKYKKMGLNNICIMASQLLAYEEDVIFYPMFDNFINSLLDTLKEKINSLKIDCVIGE